MNQTPRKIKTTCIKCKKNKAWAEQLYDRNTADYITVSPPICEECREKIEKERNNFIMNDL